MAQKQNACNLTFSKGVWNDDPSHRVIALRQFVWVRRPAPRVQIFLLVRGPSGRIAIRIVIQDPEFTFADENSNGMGTVTVTVQSNNVRCKPTQIH